jgi:short-subunit dehydrogenase
VRFRRPNFLLAKAVETDSRLRILPPQTGATGGIGFSTARLMYRAGCNLIVTGSNQEKMNRLLADLVDGEGKVWSYICDLTKPKEIAHMIEKSVTECSPVDILINNVSYSVSPRVRSSFPS